AGPDLDTVGSLATAYAALAPSESARALAAIARDYQSPEPVRRKAAEAVAVGADWRVVWDSTLRTAPLRTQAKLAQALAATPEGREALVRLVEDGRANPRLLLDRNVAERLKRNKEKAFEQRIGRLTANLSPVNEEIQRLIEDRAWKYTRF